MFAYSCSIKIHASGFNELLESIFFLLLVVKGFALQKVVWGAWRSGSWLASGQVKVADEAKLRRPMHSSFEALVVQHAVRGFHGEELGQQEPLARGVATYTHVLAWKIPWTEDWWDTVYGVPKSQIQLRNQHFHFFISTYSSQVNYV